MDMIERLRAEGSQLSIDAAAEITRLTMARIPHKDDNALGLGLLNFFIDMMQRDHPHAHRREMLVSYISNTTAPLRDDNARLRAALVNLRASCNGHIKAINQGAGRETDGFHQINNLLKQCDEAFKALEAR